MLGNGRTRLVCSDEDKQRTGNIRGKMKKKVWINQGDIVLVSLRGFQDDKCDIIHKYNSDEVKTLKTEGEIIGAVAQVTEAEGFVSFPSPLHRECFFISLLTII